jgi:hypothetical protein
MGAPVQGDVVENKFLHGAPPPAAPARPAFANLNVALANAPGIESTTHLSAVTLKVRAGQLPMVEAEFHLHSPDGLRAVRQCYALTPRPEWDAPPAPPASVKAA